jgi:amino acid transporter
MPQPNSEQNVILSKPNASISGLGTFSGVYTPSLLTILGVIMYLRFGWVVGHVGLWQTLLIVTLSTSITFLTGLSIAAIATDQVVKVGGAYYMISRSLGIETGGAVGVPLYFAQAFSVALYTIGFAESLVQIFPSLNQTMIAAVATVAVTILALKSAEIAIRVQYVIMAAIALSLISLALGHPVEPTSLTPPEPTGSAGFWAVLAVFFPAVTGIMAGVNMSGDLREPRRSIPIGTLAAIGTGYIIYMLIPIFLSRWADPQTLLAEPLVMRRMALWGDAILLGVWGATLSSAIGSILGAPRILQALARDGILPRQLRWLGKGEGVNDEPRLGTLFTLGIALAAVSLGDLNLIAPVLTMFFLTTYLVLNVAAGVEGFLQSPSFRPSFKVPWAFSLLGALGCLIVMFLIDAVATVMAAVIVLGVYLWLERQELSSTWGDVRQGIWMTLVRAGLLSINSTPDAKNWRPHLLVFSGAPSKRLHLIELAASLTHNRGLITVASVLPPNSRNMTQQESMEATIEDYLQRQGIQAFVRLVTAPEPFTGMERLVEAYGIGPLVPNTILLGDTENPANHARYCQTIAYCHQAKRNVLILREQSQRGIFSRPSFERRRIDVWWGGLQSNGGLMLILAYLLRTSWEWREAEICLKLVVSNGAAAQAARSNLEGLTKSLRIGAQSQVIVANGRSFDEILQSSSEGADLVLLGLAAPHDNFSQYYASLHARTANLPTTIFVLASEDLAFAELLQKD